MCIRDRSTALVVPSWFETFGLSALEAMLHGTPVLASEVGALPDLVVPEQTGWLVPPRDVDALAEAVIAATSPPRQLGDRAAARARQNLWPDRVRAALDLYAAL